MTAALDIGRYTTAAPDIEKFVTAASGSGLDYDGLELLIDIIDYFYI